jgi:hypothetical protein
MFVQQIADDDVDRKLILLNLMLNERPLEQTVLDA